MGAGHLKLIFFIPMSCFFSCVFCFNYCVLFSFSLSCFIHVSCFLFMRLVSIPVSCCLFRFQRLCLVFHWRQTVATRYFESLTSTAWAFDDRTRPVRSPPKLNIKKKWAVRAPPAPHHHLSEQILWFLIRAVESESLKVGKSLKIGKNRIKSEKSDLISY